MSEPTAIVVTLRMAADAAARYTALRRRHFPPERDWLAAHVTLFHALPVAALARVKADAAARAAATAPFAMTVAGVRFLGRGVAYDLEAPPALALRRTLAARWDDLLGRQDRAGPGRLHVTVQNKVEPAAARALHAELAAGFTTETVGATGLELWGYVGGPWEAIAAFGFGAAGG